MPLVPNQSTISDETRERAEIEELLAKERNDFENEKQELSDRILSLEGNGINAKHRIET